jgi:hypothetical protein
LEVVMVGLGAVVLADAIAIAPPHVAATRTSDPPTIDGKLDDAAWKLAPAVSTFTQKFPDEGDAPSDATIMRILYDDDALYVAFECHQAHAAIVDRLTRRDREVEADRVSVFVGSRGDRKTAYEFTVDASGTLVDAIRYDDTERSLDWDENWEARTSIEPQAWTAELKIPLRILRFETEATQSWDFQARRYISEKQETDEWSFIPRSVAGEVSHYGTLDALEGLEARSPLELRPFVLGRFRRLDAGSTGAVSGTDFKVSGGLDLKWHPTDSLVLDATINPDFAQVEADQLVLNLTSYETYYPEKRPFFLEGIDLFATPRQLLYTRRIGRAAPSPTLRTDAPYGEQLVDIPQPATIYGASKLVGSLADKWQIATLQALTARNDVEVQDQNGVRTSRPIDPLSAYEVVRIKRELPGNGYVGVMATAVTHAELSGNNPFAPASLGGGPGTALCPSGVVVPFGHRCFDDAYVGALDWRWRSDGGDWITGGQMTATTLRDGPPRFVRDGTVINPGDVGTGAFVYLNKEGGKHWVGESQFEYEGRKLDYNDLGYNQRSNDYRWWLALEYRELEKWWELLETHARVEIFGRTNLKGQLIGHGYQINTSGKLSNFWTFFTEVHWRPTYFDDREIGDGTALQRAGLFGYELEFASDPTKRVSFEVNTQTQWLSDGFAEYGDAGVLFRALPQLDVELLPTWVVSVGEPRYAAAGAAPGEYVFGKLNAKSIGTVLRATYTFTPRLTLQTYGQLFLASGHYSDFTSFTSDPNGDRPTVHLSDLQPYATPLPTNPDFQQGALNLSAVLRWEYTLGSTLFLVYTRSQAPIVTLLPGEAAMLSVGSVRRAPAADVIMAKISYWWATK